MNKKLLSYERKLAPSPWAVKPCLFNRFEGGRITIPHIFWDSQTKMTPLFGNVSKLFPCFKTWQCTVFLYPVLKVGVIFLQLTHALYLIDLWVAAFDGGWSGRCLICSRILTFPLQCEVLWAKLRYFFLLWFICDVEPSRGRAIEKASVLFSFYSFTSHPIFLTWST